jgi:hypothetical protein
MRTLAAVLAGMLLAGGCLAANARSDRAAIHFRRDQLRREYLNWQWTRHMRALANDTARAYSSDPRIRRTSDLYRLRQQARDNMQHWLSNSNRATGGSPPPGYRVQPSIQRRRAIPRR